MLADGARDNPKQVSSIRSLGFRKTAPSFGQIEESSISARYRGAAKASEFPTMGCPIRFHCLASACRFEHSSGKTAGCKISVPPAVLMLSQGPAATINALDLS